MENEPAAPPIVDRSTINAELDALRVREKAHTKEGDALAAARRRLRTSSRSPRNWNSGGSLRMRASMPRRVWTLGDRNC